MRSNAQAILSRGGSCTVGRLELAAGGEPTAYWRQYTDDQKKCHLEPCTCRAPRVDFQQLGTMIYAIYLLPCCQKCAMTHALRRFERTYFDVRVFNPLCRTNSGSIESTYHRHESEKRRHYEARVTEIEGGSFCPIVLSTLGGYSPSAKALVKRLSILLSDKLDIPPEKTITWLRNRVSMSICGATVMCTRGARSRAIQQLTSSKRKY